MNDDELWDALDGLYAYDMGAIDSGIHDEALRERVKTELWKDLGPNGLFTGRITRLVRDRMLTDQEIAAGRSLEDVAEFTRWLDEEMR